jgi:hypothetical protein
MHLSKNGDTSFATVFQFQYDVEQTRGYARDPAMVH